MKKALTTIAWCSVCIIPAHIIFNDTSWSSIVMFIMGSLYHWGLEQLEI